MFLHLCHSVHRGVSATHPLSRHPLHNAYWDTVNKRAVCILLECILVTKVSVISKSGFSHNDRITF